MENLNFNPSELGGRRFVSQRNKNGRRDWEENNMTVEITSTHIYLSKKLWQHFDLIEKSVVSMDVKNNNIYLLKVEESLLHFEAILKCSKEKTSGDYIGARACRNKKLINRLSNDPSFKEGIYDCVELTESNFPCMRLVERVIVEDNDMNIDQNDNTTNINSSVNTDLSEEVDIEPVNEVQQEEQEESLSW